MVDLLGPAGRARILSQMLVSLQEQEYDLRLTQLANNAEDYETVPGQDYAYGTRLAELRDAQKRLLESADENVVNGLRRLTNGK